MIILDCIAHWVLSKFKCNLSRHKNWRKYWLFYVIEVYPKILSDCLFLPFFFTTIFHPFIIAYSRLWELNFKIKSGFIYEFAFCLSWSGNISTKIDFPLLRKSLLTLQCWCVTSGWRKQCLSTGNSFISNIRRGR